MPMYPYHCPICNLEFEQLQTVSEYEAHKDCTPCPACGHRPVMRVFTPVALRTSTDWLSRHGTLLDQFGDTREGRSQLEFRVKQAQRKYGFTPNRHMVYDPTLAPAPGHPDGFIPHDDATGHIKRTVAKRGLVNGRPIQREPPQTDLAPDILERLRKRAIDANPDLAHHDQEELREEIKSKHSYKRST